MGLFLQKLRVAEEPVLCYHHFVSGVLPPGLWTRVLYLPVVELSYQTGVTRMRGHFASKGRGYARSSPMVGNWETNKEVMCMAWRTWSQGWFRYWLLHSTKIWLGAVGERAGFAPIHLTHTHTKDLTTTDGSTALIHDSDHGASSSSNVWEDLEWDLYNGPLSCGLETSWKLYVLPP